MTGSGICQDLTISNWFDWTYLHGLVPLVWSGSNFSAVGSLAQAGSQWFSSRFRELPHARVL